jgi:hypothetical protein
MDTEANVATRDEDGDAEQGRKIRPQTYLFDQPTTAGAENFKGRSADTLFNSADAPASAKSRFLNPVHLR